MCTHSWVNTGLPTWTYCKYCDAEGDWVFGEVVLRPTKNTYALSLELFGLPIRYNRWRVGASWGVPFIEVKDVWVDKTCGELSSGKYDSLRVEQCYSDITLVLIGEENGTKGWMRVDCPEAPNLVKFIESLLPANAPA
jgi:hypothetical protein